MAQDLLTAARSAAALLLLVGLAPAATAQGVAQPLSTHGLDQFLDIGAQARAMGGAHVGAALGAAALFYDPAGLTALDRPEVRLGGEFRTTASDQVQHWTPNRFHVELSLLMENSPYAVTPRFDDLGADWNHSHSTARPALATAALPFRLGGVDLRAALGYATVLDLHHYFQNNNALAPNIGRIRPAPFPRIQQGDSLQVEWFQHVRERTGAVHAFTPALALQLSDAFSVGASLSVLRGSSRESESRTDRGLFTLRAGNDLTLAPGAFQGTRSAESTYSGLYATVSGRYTARYVQVGLSLRTPYTLERTWTAAGSAAPQDSPPPSGVDALHMPLLLSAGVTLLPTEWWMVSASYDRRGFDRVTWDPAGSDPEASPWTAGNVFRAGAEFTPLPWLSLRGGYRDYALTFVPEGSGLISDPARATVYAAGAGLSYGRYGLDLALERTTMDYQDRWLSNTNFNRSATTAVVVEAYVRF